MVVVVPTFNRRDLLMKTLESLRGQQTQPDDCTVVSDGSTDGTDEMAKDAGFTVLRTDRRQAAGARNRGWCAAQHADVVAFIDDDCQADAGWLTALLAPFADPTVGLVQGRTEPAGPMGPFDRSISVAGETGLYESCNIAYRRSVLEQVGGFDESFGTDRWSRRGGASAARPFGEDTDLAWRARRAGWRAAFAPDAVVRHHVFPGTFADRLRESWRHGNFAPLMRHIPELRDCLPGSRWFLRRHGPLVDLALAGAVVAVRRPRIGAALLAPYTVWLIRRHRRPAPLVRQVATDVVTSVSLLTSSARSRSMLL